MKKRILSLFLAFVMVLGIIPISAVTVGAAESVCSGHQLSAPNASGNSYCVNSNGDYHVYCPYNFSVQLRDKLYAKYGSYVTGEQLASFSELDLVNVVSSRGLELFVDLDSLSLSLSERLDKLDLTCYNNLKKLSVSGSVEDVIYDNSTAITELYWSFRSDDFDFKWIEDMTSIEVLTIDGFYFPDNTSKNTIIDLSKLTNLKSLTLDCSNGTYYDNNVIKLGKYDKLEYADLLYCNIISLNLDDASNLQSFNSKNVHFNRALNIKSDVLETFDIYNSELKILPGLTLEGEKLEEISIFNVSLEKLDFTKCPNVTTIDLADSLEQLYSEINIAGLDKLTYFELHNFDGAWESSDSFRLWYGNNTSLERFWLKDHNFSGINGILDLKAFPAVTFFSLDNTSVKQLISEDHTALETLHLENNMMLKNIVIDAPNIEKLYLTKSTDVDLKLINTIRLTEIKMEDGATVNKLDLSDCTEIKDVYNMGGRAYKVSDGTLVNPVFSEESGITLNSWNNDGEDKGFEIINGTKYSSYPNLSGYHYIHYYRKGSNNSYEILYYTDMVYVTERETITGNSKILGWSTTQTDGIPGEIEFYSNDELSMTEHHDLFPEDGILKLYAVYGETCNIRCHYYLENGVTQSIKSINGPYKPIGSDTYEITLPTQEEYPRPRGKYLAGWEVYDFDDPSYNEDYTVYKPGETITLHGNAGWIAVYEDAFEIEYITLANDRKTELSTIEYVPQSYKTGEFYPGELPVESDFPMPPGYTLYGWDVFDMGSSFTSGVLCFPGTSMDYMGDVKCVAVYNDPFPKIESVSVNGTEVDDGENYIVKYVPAGSVGLESTYDTTMSEEVSDLGCSYRSNVTFYIDDKTSNNGFYVTEEINKYYGTTTTTAVRSRNAYETLKMVTELIIIWPDGYREVVDSHTVTVEVVPEIDTIAFELFEPIATMPCEKPEINFIDIYNCELSDYGEPTWYRGSEAGYWYEMEEGEVFTYGTIYKCVFYVKGKHGITFSNDSIFAANMAIPLSADVVRISGRNDVVMVEAEFLPCDYGAELEFIDQSPDFVENYGNNNCLVETAVGTTIDVSFNTKPLTDLQKAQGLYISRSLSVFEGINNCLYQVLDDEGEEPLSYTFNMESETGYLVMETIHLYIGDKTLTSKLNVYLFKENLNVNPSFYRQPVGGEVLPGESLTVKWGTNFSPLKTQLVTYRTSFRVLVKDLDSPTALSTNLKALSNGYYKIRTYYSETEYIDSNAIYVTEIEELSYSVGGIISGVNAGTEVTVELWKDGESSPSCTSTFVGNGEYAWSEVMEGEYTVKVFADGYSDYSAKITVDEDVSYNITLVPLPSATIQGTVKSTGASQDAVTITLYNGNTQITSVSKTGNTVTYSFTDLDAGKYTVKAERNGCIAKSMQVSLEGKDITTNITLVALPSDFILGDADGNGLVNIADVLLVRKYIAGMIDDNMIDLRAVDVTGDGRVTIADVLKIRKYIAGLIDEF